MLNIRPFQKTKKTVMTPSPASFTDAHLLLSLVGSLGLLELVYQ